MFQKRAEETAVEFRLDAALIEYDSRGAAGLCEADRSEPRSRDQCGAGGTEAFQNLASAESGTHGGGIIVARVEKSTLAVKCLVQGFSRFNRFSRFNGFNGFNGLDVWFSMDLFGELLGNLLDVVGQTNSCGRRPHVWRCYSTPERRDNLVTSSRVSTLMMRTLLAVALLLSVTAGGAPSWPSAITSSRPTCSSLRKAPATTVSLRSSISTRMATSTLCSAGVRPILPSSIGSSSRTPAPGSSTRSVRTTNQMSASRRSMWTATGAIDLVCSGVWSPQHRQAHDGTVRAHSLRRPRGRRTRHRRR